MRCEGVLAKTKPVVYQCTECGATAPKWQGQCPDCGQWNTLVETIPVAAPTRFQTIAGASSARAAVLDLAAIPATDAPRHPTGIGELDRVLGGGTVDGAVILLGGDPGIGKSTLLLQALATIGSTRPALYVTGEESPQQVALRSQRLEVAQSRVGVLAEIQLEAIAAAIRERSPRVVVIDSIQTVYTEALTSAPGSVAQVRECAAQLTRLAKQGGVTVILVGHVTKEGAIAGPRVLEHIVDTVLYFEGDTHSRFRIIRAIKNRFGAINELGVFAMTERGLRGVSNPSALFLSQHAAPVAGSCVLVTLEGSRPLLVEVQALVDDVQGAAPRRLAVGMESTRLALLLAVLHRHAGIACADQDVFVNAVGGVRIAEPAADLAILVAIVSSIRNRPLPDKLVVFGEVGLAGEVRPVQGGQERLREAAKLGFATAIIPQANEPRGGGVAGLVTRPVARVGDVLAALWGDAR
jgi:DNA repair protein RadA/Sms